MDAWQLLEQAVQDLSHLQEGQAEHGPKQDKREAPSQLRTWALPTQRGLGARPHLLKLDASILEDQQQDLGGQVAAQVAVTVEAVQQREDQLCVLRHRQVLAEGLLWGWGVLCSAAGLTR